MTQLLFVLDNEHQIGAVKRVLPKENPKGKMSGACILLLSMGAGREKMSGFSILYFDDFVKTNIDYKSKVAAWLKQVSCRKLGKKTIKELISAKDFSAWWIFEYWLTYGGGVYFNNLMNDFELVDRLSAVFKSVHPAKVISFSSHDALNMALKSVSEANGAGFALELGFKSKLEVSVNRISKSAALASLSVFRKLRFFLRKYFYNSLALFRKRKIKHPCALALMKIPPIQYYNSVSETIEKKDIFNICLGKMKKKYNYAVLDFPNSTKLGLADMYKDISGKDSLFFPIEHFFSKKTKSLAKEDFLSVKKGWKNISESGSAHTLFNYNNIDMFSYLKPRLDFFFLNYVYDSLLELEAMNAALKATQPKLVFSSVEVTSTGRISAYCAKKNKIPLFGYRHGTVNTAIEFYHTLEEISSRLGPNYCPLADITFLGADYVDFFVKKCSYPRKSLFFSGDPSYDLFFYSSRIYDRDKICRDLGLDPEKRFVMLTTQSSALGEDDEKVLDAFFSAIKNDKTFVPIVKAHPAEHSLEIHNKIAVKYGFKDILITKDKNLYELLFISDVLVTVFSSTLLEAVVMGKAPVIIDLSSRGYRDLFGPEAKGIINVKNSDELKTSFAYLAKKENLKKYLAGLDPFVRKNAHKNDGKSADRIAAKIEGFMKKN